MSYVMTDEEKARFREAMLSAMARLARMSTHLGCSASSAWVVTEVLGLDVDDVPAPVKESP